MRGWPFLFFVATNNLVDVFVPTLLQRNDQVSGTTYAAFGRYDMSSRFALDPSCVLFLYQINENGSPDFADVIKETILGSTTDVTGVNHVFWSYPCGPGEYSVDGIAHGDAIFDKRGNSINENDPSPCGDLFSVPCADPCQPCAFRLVWTPRESSLVF